jgi:saccharopine dehydrogenase (NAD+, L-glutamate forming)
MLGEAALLLTEDERRGQGSGGFHTPATAFGDALIEALQEHAGLTFDIDPTFE